MAANNSAHGSLRRCYICSVRQLNLEPLRGHAEMDFRFELRIFMTCSSEDDHRHVATISHQRIVQRPPLRFRDYAIETSVCDQKRRRIRPDAIYWTATPYVRIVRRDGLKSEKRIFEGNTKYACFKPGTTTGLY